MPTDSKDGIVAEAAGAVEFGVRISQARFIHSDISFDLSDHFRVARSVERSDGDRCPSSSEGFEDINS